VPGVVGDVVDGAGGGRLGRLDERHAGGGQHVAALLVDAGGAGDRLLDLRHHRGRHGLVDDDGDVEPLEPAGRQVHARDGPVDAQRLVDGVAPVVGVLAALGGVRGRVVGRRAGGAAGGGAPAGQRLPLLPV